MVPVGFKMSEESKAKMRAAKLGIPRKPFTNETRQKIRAANIGKQLSEETKEKLRLANLGKKMHPEVREKMRQAVLLAKSQNPVTEETRKRLAEAHEKETLTKFFKATLNDDSCWIYAGRKQEPLPENSRIRFSRRIYRLLIGPLSPDLNVCHACDIPPCVRPSHFWLGTQKDNIDDMVKKGRCRKSKKEIHPCRSCI